MKTNFPSHQEFLDECAAGLREHKARQALLSTIDAMNKLSAMPISPQIREAAKNYVSYADYMAGRNGAEQ